MSSSTLVICFYRLLKIVACRILDMHVQIEDSIVPTDNTRI